MKIPELRLYRKRQVRKWLELLRLQKIDSCPFSGQRRNTICTEICLPAFPRLNKVVSELTGEPTTYSCPCSKYSVSYVERIARRMIK